jgi:meiosis-specific transcription factor NDT80
VTLGTLSYQDSSRTAAKIGVQGCIDKGFFQADGEWTCYRRNYFSCVCHYTLSPYYPGVPVDFTPSPTSSRAQTSTVQGFSMKISAVVADNDQQEIELVQHTPKRDKGPTTNPPRVALMAKHESGHHNHAGIYGNNGAMVPNGNPHYPDAWVASDTAGNSTLTETTFERIQFKQATQNNGKRRAAQQYYHLIIELWANIGPPGGQESWIKIAYRKSAKMIVRGRSPGHYQNDRRGSSSNGPPGSSGTISTYHNISSSGEFNASSMLSNYSGYNAQSSVYGGPHNRHHGLPAEVVIPQEEQKEIETTKGYQYYPGSIYDSQADQRVELFNHQSESEPHHPSSHADMDTKGKMEYEPVSNMNTLPRIIQPPLLSSDRRRCGPFDGKPSSSGYYPHAMSPSAMSISMS